MARKKDRSYRRIEPQDLTRLAGIARRDREAFFGKNKRWREYRRRLLLVALCQGAARHYVDGTTGIKDFDVWTFYREHPKLSPFPYRRNVARDFGDGKFGRRLGRRREWRNFKGRPVDLLSRSIPAGGNPIYAVQKYLAKRRTTTSRLLAKKAVVVLEPLKYRGFVIWFHGLVKASREDGPPG